MRSFFVGALLVLMAVGCTTTTRVIVYEPTPTRRARAEVVTQWRDYGPLNCLVYGGMFCASAYYYGASSYGWASGYYAYGAWWPERPAGQNVVFRSR